MQAVKCVVSRGTVVNTHDVTNPQSYLEPAFTYPDGVSSGEIGLGLEGNDASVCTRLSCISIVCSKARMSCLLSPCNWGNIFIHCKQTYRRFGMLYCSEGVTPVLDHRIPDMPGTTMEAGRGGAGKLEKELATRCPRRQSGSRGQHTCRRDGGEQEGKEKERKRQSWHKTSPHHHTTSHLQRAA